ncbi:hypothetical protein DFH09DRAFT_1082345 [Mycena vulgaris]|nr:hypothetical protein DFH09DRAFT_1082345 [Mycena vulgaris]
MLESDPNEDKKNFGICFCRLFDFKAQTWLSKDGQVKQGKWYSRVTILKHAKKDQELVAERYYLYAPQAVSVPIEPVTPMPAIIGTNANILEGEPSIGYSDCVESVVDWYISDHLGRVNGRVPPFADHSHSLIRMFAAGRSAKYMFKNSSKFVPTLQVGRKS